MEDRAKPIKQRTHHTAGGIDRDQAQDARICHLMAAIPDHVMPLVFVYGTLKCGHQNAHLNTGVRLAGEFRTHTRLPLLLLGEGHVPCLVLSPGIGHQVQGEVYEVDKDAFASLDRLERLGSPVGYQRVYIEVERMDEGKSEIINVQTYAKPPDQIALETLRIGPLVEYTTEHAVRFKW